MSPQRTVAAWALWALTVPVAVATTVGEQACDPPMAAVVGLAAVGGALLVWASLRERWGAVWWAGILTLSALPVARPLVVDGVPWTHDLAPHAWALDGVARGLETGSWWPGWVDTMGVGMPLGTFYPPVPYMLGAVPLALGASMPRVWVGLLGLAGLLAAGAIGLVVRDRGGSVAAASVGAVALLLAPYRLLDVGYRGALGEVFGVALLPLFWHLCVVVARGEPGAVLRHPRRALWASACLLVLCHPLSLIMGLVGLAVVLPLAVPVRGWTGAAGRLGAVGALVGLATAAFVLPVVFELGETWSSVVIPQSARAYAAKSLHVTQALTRGMWDGLRVSYTLGVEATRLAEGKSVLEVPHYLGLPLALASAAGLAMPRLRPWALVVVVCWVATMPLPATAMGHVPMLRPLQFPWRFLGPASVAGALVLAGLVDTGWRRGRPAVVALVVAVFVVDGWPGLGAPSWVPWPDVPGLIDHAVFRGVETCPEAKARLGRRAVPIVLPEPLVASDLEGPILEGAAWVGAPTGDLIPRVDGLYLPPARRTPRVALTHRVQPEFFTRATATSIRQPLGEGEAWGRAQAGQVATVGHLVEPVAPWPRVRLITPEGTFGLAARVRRPGPSRMELALPAGHPGGRLVVVEQAFVGWRARVDGGVWQVAGAEDGLLAVDVPAGATSVVMATGWTTPARRVGLGLTGLGLVLAGLAMRRGWM